MHNLVAFKPESSEHLSRDVFVNFALVKVLNRQPAELNMARWKTSIAISYCDWLAQAPTDHDGFASDPCSVIRSEKHHGRGDIARLAQTTERCLRDHLLFKIAP